MLLEGKIAVITGAGRGLGKAMARIFAREGAQVLAVDISGEEKAVAAGIGSSVVPYHADVAREDEIEAMFAFALSRFGKVDALVNNAATLMALREELTAGEYEEGTAVNLRGLMFCCKHAIRAMAKGGGGSIVNIASVLGITTAGLPQAAYASSKAGVIGLTRDLAQQWGHRKGIRVNAIAPGFFASEMTDAYPPGYLEAQNTRIVLQRTGDPEELAATAIWLASPAAGYVVGQTIPVDGGITIS